MMLWLDGVGNSIIEPDVLMRPILTPTCGGASSVNHRAPSGPVAMVCGQQFVGSGYSVMAPVMSMRPIMPVYPTISTVNQSAPSGAAVMPDTPHDAWQVEHGAKVGKGIGNSVNTPAV